MLCLKCGLENQGPGPSCTRCQFHLGLVAEQRGFMPQLYAVQKSQRQRSIAPEEVRQVLTRLDQALGTMIRHVDQTRNVLSMMNLEETRAGVLGGFLAPLRDSMESFRGEALTLEGQMVFPDATLSRMDHIQVSIARGSEGVAYLIQNLQSFLVEKTRKE
ncbi:hypothetical protein DYH09_15750 [bacterium CPR1]|nr:hypothetical protein [bacterium CPR1]